jgi:hypothetical protein
MEKEKGGIKNQFIFSPIFEKEEDCIDNPFVFKKFELTSRSPKDSYPLKRMDGLLLRQKKSKKVTTTLANVVFRKKERAQTSSPKPNLKSAFLCSATTGSSSSK